MSDWNSEQYLKFKRQRTQPAVDLAMRVQSDRIRSIVDIGCGPGNSTSVLKNLFPYAEILGIDSSENLIPFLMGHLNPGGVLAVQIPMNEEEPLFTLIKEIAQEAKWGLKDVPIQPNGTLTPAEYFNILAGCSSSFDIWETKYYHSLPDHKSLVDWVKGTRIRPYLDCLGEKQGIAFENEIAERAKALYPVMDNGEILLGFRRFFFTAIK